jgi:hypothetical protein
VIQAIERLASAALRWGRVEVLAEIDGLGRRLPIHAVSLGSAGPDDPVFVVVGGVHGLERIGTEVAIAYLQTLLAQLDWDEVLHHALARCRILVVPLVNPVGMAAHRRSNGNGVDLMRNAPVHPASGGTPLVGGHRLSARLPWFMGKAGAPMEAEAAALAGFVERETFGSRFAIVLDLHSGFGMQDRVWFPYARTRTPLPDLPTVYALKRLLDENLPNHVYRIEPTARVYTIQGDLWDHLYDRRRGAGPGVLLPLTLEMGSWTWVRKNPLQLATPLGGFNPVKPHRKRRTLRRHLPLLEFLFRAARSSHLWSSFDDETKRSYAAAGFAEWFR